MLRMWTAADGSVKIYWVRMIEIDDCGMVAAVVM